MNQTVFQVDAFANGPFMGNPAAVYPMQSWLPDHLLQAIAEEHNLSETAFFVPLARGDYQLRWFTPRAEVDLCGHATLAASAVVLGVLEPGLDAVAFQTRSGQLRVQRDGHGYSMDFPSQPPTPCGAPSGLIEALGKEPRATLSNDDVFAVFDSESDIRGLEPDYHRLRHLETRGICVTAPGDDCDFVSRFFAPKLGIDEDPVTGSAHCGLTPYWARLLGKRTLRAIQCSPRTGQLTCTLKEDRVFLQGTAHLFMRGTVTLPPGP